MILSKSALVALSALAVMAGPGAALAQVANPYGAMQNDRSRPVAVAVVEGSSFKCEGGRDLLAQFSSRGANIVAIVDAGDGQHVLPLRPWDGGVPVITWSDGPRTLTWSAGVELMYMDGPKHLACGRGEHEHGG